MTITSDTKKSDSVSFNVIIRSILISRAKEGATIAEIRADYYYHVGENFPSENVIDVLLSVPGVACTKNTNGTFIFNITISEKAQHVLDMVKNQKESRKRRRDDSTEDLCYFKDNYQNKNFSAGLRKKPRSNFNSPACCLYDYLLLGDDFFLSLARMELKCKFEPGHKILQSGLCISGQTIADAKRRVEKAKFSTRSVIINIGSVDILHGHDLIDMKQDFMDLIAKFRDKDVNPIVTTLAPLANYHHRPQLKRNLDRFNEFLRCNFTVIDIWQCMVSQHGHTLYECFQQDARYVTGSIFPHVFWNKLGRQRILKCIKNFF